MSSIGALGDKVQEVKGIVVENLRKVIHRGEQIEELDETARVLETDADEFRKVSKEVRKKKQWAYYRCLIITIIVILVIIAIIVAIVVGVVVSKNKQ